MAAAEWRNLPSEILVSISKLFKTDIDLVRLRSVCSPWRSSLPLPRKPFSFPLKLPPIRPFHFFSIDALNGFFTLNKHTCYLVSPPATESLADDLSSGWIFKVSETNTNPNTFSLLDPLMQVNRDYSLISKPNHLNLLHYRVSEICNSYTVTLFNSKGSLSEDTVDRSYKVHALWNFFPGCEFAALSLGYGRLCVWKFGDEFWTPIHKEGSDLDDVILYNGECYAVDSQETLYSFDSESNLTIVVASPEWYPEIQSNYLVEYESDLYMVSKFWDRNFRLELKLRVFNKCKGKWDAVEDAEDMVFVLCGDAKFGVSVKDFGGCKGNRVYFKDAAYVEDNEDGCGVYHLDDKRGIGLTMAEDCGKIFWPPPSYLYV